METDLQPANAGVCTVGPCEALPGAATTLLYRPFSAFGQVFP